MSDMIPEDARPRLPRGVRLRQDPARATWLLLAPETLFELNQSSVEILRRCDGNISRAARESGLHRKSIARLVTQYSLDAKGM